MSRLCWCGFERGFLYFALAFFVYKWLFVHVYTKQYDLMGETWHLGFQGRTETFILEDAVGIGFHTSGLFVDSLNLVTCENPKIRELSL